MKLMTPLGVALLVFCGCDWKRPAHSSDPKLLAHRYEESVLLDQAAVDCWHWRPLPDSLSLLGYEGARFIARLTRVPGDFRFLHRYDVVHVPADLKARQRSSPEEIRSGGGLPAACDVVWDIFWIRKAPDTVEIHQRFEIIEEKDGQCSGVSNRPVIEITTVHLPAGVTSHEAAVYRVLPVRFDERQNLYSVTFHPDAEDMHSAPGTRLQWYFEGGKQ